MRISRNKKPHVCKDRIHLMKILDKIDELELDEDFVEVLISKLKEIKNEC